MTKPRGPFVLEVRARGGFNSLFGPQEWQPAITGTLNQSGLPDDEASQFEVEAEADTFGEHFVAPIQEVIEWRVRRVES